MTNEQITQWAREANVSIRGHYDETGSTPIELQAFAALVRNATLEELAAAKRENAELRKDAERYRTTPKLDWFKTRP